MISLILPYWNRQEAANKALHLMHVQYPDLVMEVIVVDDGSPVPFVAQPHLRFPVRVIRLPYKTEPLSPCVPFNVGAAAAIGDYIALSNPEIMHDMPVLPAMLADCVRGGPLAYVMAACRDADSGRWHCHSSMRRNDTSDVGSFLPPGSNYHFMSMMSRQLWDTIGGFDEDYRHGAGYDDPDLVMRLHRAGAIFSIRDDLVVTHPRKDCRAAWSPSGYARNRQKFMEKWAPR